MDRITFHHAESAGNLGERYSIRLNDKQELIVTDKNQLAAGHSE